MADCYLGEIRTYAGTTPPKGWLPCDGRSLPVESNKALFSLLGARFGGNGTDTFCLPDLRGRTPLGLDWQSHTNSVGTQGGQESVALTVREMPAHTHNLMATTSPGTTGGVPNAIFSAVASNGATPAQNVYAEDSIGGQRVSMEPASVVNTGSSAPHPNMQPYLVVNFMIATQGLYPSHP